MARNVEMRDRVGGIFDHADSLLYPRTHVNMVEGLLTNGKLTLGLIPDGLKNGLKYTATQGSATDTAALLTALNSNLTNLGLDTASAPGSFFFTSPSYTLTVSANHIVKGDDGGAEVVAGGTLILGNNDWIVYRGNFTGTHIWDIVNNTHGLATADVAGLMSAANFSKLAGIATGANNYSHPTQAAIDVNATDDGLNVIDRVQVDTSGHVTAVSTRNLSVATTSAAGPMSAADKVKLDGIAAGATNYSLPVATNLILGGIKVGSRLSIASGVLSADDMTYTHPTQTAISHSQTTGETINAISVNTLGHVTAISKQDIRTGSTSQTGLLQLAAGTELTTALSTSKALTPSSVKSMVDYFLGMKRYADLTTANAASHPDGTIVLVTVA